MHVLMTVHGQPPELVGGTERHVEDLSSELCRRGHAITVVTGSLAHSVGETRVVGERREDGIRLRRVLRGEIEFEEWTKCHSPGVSRAFAAMLAELQPDVVHVHHWIRLTTDLVRQCWHAGIPSVVSIHDYSTTCPIHHRVLRDGSFCRRAPGPEHCGECLRPQLRPWRGDDEVARVLALRQSDFANELRLANVLSPLSADLRSGLGELAVAEADRMLVQPFASGLQLRRAPEPDPLARPLRILNLGRVTPLKGQHVLLEAVAATTNPRAFEVHLAGPVDDAAYGARLDQLAVGLRVVRRGGYEYSALERETHHLAVLPSLCRETYGLVLDEVQSLGLPAFATRFGAHAERIGAGGATFAPGDARSLAALLDRAEQDRAWLARLRANVPPPRSFARLTDFFEECYRRAIAEGPRAVDDRFDLQGHLEDLALRVDSRERALWARGLGTPGP
ncbi:MAG: glycosyltransferase [Planctomycetes bacterium]|nr:glycosyltransferase [Planctomycetota bacterium]